MADERPAVWVGHITLPVTELERSTRFWTGLGMRAVELNPHVSVLELRGGTHLVLLPGETKPEPGSAVAFDLMVEDIDATHEAWAAAGLEPSAIARGPIHASFTLADPDGWILTVNSSHVVGAV
jgi:catechol 2,3-dioxygenase-like lactoylglutathione lyase family enzyme